MEILQWCKMQVACLLVLAFIGIVYLREGNEVNRIIGMKKCNAWFDAMLVVAEIAVLFDGITAVTVNFIDTVPVSVNMALHLGMYFAYEAFVALLFIYWVDTITGGIRGKGQIISAIAPAVAFAVATLLLVPFTELRLGRYTNYSMGPSVYACFACIFWYFAMTIIFIARKRSFITRKKKESLLVVLATIVIIVAIQVMVPQCLLSSIAITIITVSIYINSENPTYKELEHYHREMITGFATLVESKDDSTGGHIRRTSLYAMLIAQAMKQKPEYEKVITKDFIENISLAAPMHDIGKIGIPDAVLQKPGRLTDEEFEVIKQHPAMGGDIIKNTFGQLGRPEYEKMAFEVARFHHEKFNGRGYPDGLSFQDIPLAARIMAVADVFDAVSAKRCYRDAMPLDKCFQIIQDGRCTDFDPDVVDAFMSKRETVTEIYRSMQGN